MMRADSYLMMSEFLRFAGAKEGIFPCLKKSGYVKTGKSPGLIADGLPGFNYALQPLKGFLFAAQGNKGFPLQVQ